MCFIEASRRRRILLNRKSRSKCGTWRGRRRLGVLRHMFVLVRVTAVTQLVWTLRLFQWPSAVFGPSEFRIWAWAVRLWTDLRHIEPHSVCCWSTRFINVASKDAGDESGVFAPLENVVVLYFKSVSWWTGLFRVYDDRSLAHGIVLIIPGIYDNPVVAALTILAVISTYACLDSRDKVFVDFQSSGCYCLGYEYRCGPFCKCAHVRAWSCLLETVNQIWMDGWMDGDESATFGDVTGSWVSPLPTAIPYQDGLVVVLAENRSRTECRRQVTS